MPSTLCRASHLWSFWRLTPKRSASSVIVYRPLRYNSMKRVRSFTGPATSQGITRPPFRGTSVTHVPGLFCHLCARSVPSQKLSRPGAGPAAELPSQHTRITASRRLQIASRGSATPRRQPPCRVGFGTWALAVQLRLKSLGRRAQCVCKSIDQSTALRHDYEPAVPRSRRRRRTREGHASLCHRTSARGSLHVLRAITDRDHERGVFVFCRRTSARGARRLVLAPSARSEIQRSRAADLGTALRHAAAPSSSPSIRSVARAGEHLQRVRASAVSCFGT